MKNYLVIYHAPAEALAASAEQTPEEMEKGMEPWMAWAAQCGDQLVDLGQPLIVDKSSILMVHRIRAIGRYVAIQC